MAALLYKWLLLSNFFVPVNHPAARIEAPDFHPFYISVTEINHNANDKNLEIAVKIFTDDFETALLKANGVKIDLFNPKDKQLADKQVNDYFKKHLQIKLDSKPVVLEFVGFERENEAIWTYLQVSKTPAPRKIDIGNDLLYESFNSQINLMHVSVGNNRKSIKLNFPDANASFQF